MLRRTLPSPNAPSVRGEHEGRPFWLWLPKTEGPWPGMVILHGAGSRKENHGDFARMCASGGWAAISYDQRGHGESADELSPAALRDVAKMARFLASHQTVDPARICVRGSSMGGFWAIHAAAISNTIAGAIAICPAGEEHLRRMLGRKKLDFRVSEQSRDALFAWLGEHDLREAAGRMGSKPLMILHAKGDERIPSDFSAEVAARKPEPKRLLIMPGGHHRSIQHDQEMQSVALKWLSSKL